VISSADAARPAGACRKLILEGADDAVPSVCVSPGFTDFHAHSAGVAAVKASGMSLASTRSPFATLRSSSRLDIAFSLSRSLHSPGRISDRLHPLFRLGAPADIAKVANFNRQPHAWRIPGSQLVHCVQDVAAAPSCNRKGQNQARAADGLLASGRNHG
jgi:hypothetical protein